MQKYTATAMIRKFRIAPSTAPNDTVAPLNVIASKPSIFGLPKIMAMNGLMTLSTIALTTVVTAPPITTPTAMLPRAMNFLNPSIMIPPGVSRYCSSYFRKTPSLTPPQSSIPQSYRKHMLRQSVRFSRIGHSQAPDRVWMSDSGESDIQT